MNTKRIVTACFGCLRPVLLALIAMGVCLSRVAGQGFDDGSDGSLGDVAISAPTIMDLPADGRLNFKSLHITSSGSLSFRRNARNTPVFILAQGDVVLDGDNGNNSPGASAPTGGAGGPGGFDGGKPGFGAELPPGAGYGPGGGRPGTTGTGPGSAGGGSFGTQESFGGSSTNLGVTYGGGFLIPLIGGSGGGGNEGNPGQGGGGGGGAVLIASNTRIVISGNVFARGGGWAGGSFNGGSGGAIRLLAPAVAGGGQLFVNGNGLGGGAGRIRIDTIDRHELRLRFIPAGSAALGANLVVLPQAVGQLDVVEAAGNAIPLGSDPVSFTLPFGSTPNRTIKIRATGFGRVVPIRVTLTPDSGLPVVVDSTVDNSVADPAFVEVPVTVPVNTLVTVHCWTR